MRRLLITGTTLAALWAAPVQAQTGIPVVDYLELAQQVKDAAVQLQQLEQAAQQVGWAVNTYNSLVANPNLANAMSLLNLTGVVNALPVNPYALQALISGQGGISGAMGNLSLLANSAAGINHVYTCTDNTFACQNSRAAATSVAGSQATAQQIGQELDAHYKVLVSLRRDALTATTPAEREHVANQIAAEEAWMQAAQGQLNMVNIMQSAERDNRSQRDHEMLAKSVDSELDTARAMGIIQ